ncbi:hypothetical protein KUTeg_013094 [Tegillarca granosa]|uniref:Globin domain-containing protein n=1 Tax=Tegillarca granosa TaxID=220873 RepID=A0ABQ9EXV9_TEGGR|nr:hypothetical protein KUTeg_013094 [Tegillarca granosa]
MFNFVLRFFERNPRLKKLFPKIVRINDQNELELVMDNESLTQHAINVMHSLGAAVESLDESDMFNSVLIHIGKSHVNRNIKPSMILKLWPALDYGLKQMLLAEYTKEVAAAWKKVFYFMVHQMKVGMENKGPYMYEKFPSGVI